MKGRVYLAGAGPGDPGLITLKCRRVLGLADAVIYDALVNPDILAFVRAGAEKIYAGKKGKKGMKQEEINRLLQKHAAKGRTVVRLKGGDPFVFGRGGEEAEFLADHKIPFEVVPGVTSVSAVPAYAGIPVTDRRYTSVLTVVTGHSKEDSYAGPGLDWSNISPGGTLVILMGMENLPRIVSELLKNGWRGDTPVAIIRRGTLKDQEVVSGNLSSIIRTLRNRKKPFLSPAVIVAGPVVALRKKIAWRA